MKDLGLGDIFVSEFVRDVSRAALLHTIANTIHDDLYEAARIELNRRDRERLTKTGTRGWKQ